jgi:uncharacterized protein (DUF2235 family)
MKNILLLTVVLLTGCFQTVDSTEIDLANKFCKSKNSEIWDMASHMGGPVTVRCKNNEFSYISNIKL